MRVMTWNIHGGVGVDRRFDLDRVVAVVRRHDPEVLALQEVGSLQPGRPASGAAARLADALGVHMASSTLITAADGDYGHLVLSRWPLADTQIHDVSVTGREPRAAIETTARIGGRRIRLVAAHLGLSLGERRRQAAHLAAIVDASPGGTVVLGDFNDYLRHGSVQRQLAERLPARTRHRTYPSVMPLLALDRIYCRDPAMLVRSWTDRAAWRASDHLPLVAELALA